MTKKVINEIAELFEKHNIDIQLVYVDNTPQLEMTFEDEHGQTVYLDRFWQDRIKSYNIIPKENEQ